MIVLTVNPKKDPSAKSFDKTTVTIGSSKNSDQDTYLSLKEEGVLPEHIKIQLVDSQYVAFNSANDPFLTLNGKPFGRKFLKKGDLFSVGGTEIIFDFKDNRNSKVDEDLLNAQKPLKKKKERKFKGIASIDEEEEINTLLISGKDLEQGKNNSEEVVFKFKKSDEKIPKDESRNMAQPSNKDGDEQKEQRPHSETDYESTEGQQSSFDEISSSVWKRITYAVFATLIIFVIMASGVYFFVSEQTNVQEIRAAQGITDVAMALTYAQIHHVKPSSQNWSDPGFLRENLNEVLAPKYTPLSNTDIQGQFNDSPYFLRIYTSNNSSSFLVIAQPAPSILQWLIPKSAVLIDSHTMEVRKTNDIRTLNRLLADPNNLDTSNTPAISNLVHQGQVLPLNYLSTDKNPEFSPPPELAFVRPGAENLIYNAPRYYKFGEPIIQNVRDLNQSNNDSKDISAILRSIATFSKINDMVLYSTDGVEGAKQIQKKLSPYAPTRGFLIGYLNINPETSQIKNSNLIIKSKNLNQKFLSYLQSPSKMKEQQPEKPRNSELAEEKVAPISIVTIEDPLVRQLEELGAERTKELQETTAEMIALFENHSERSVSDFSEQFQDRFTRYQEKNLALQLRIERELLQLYKHYVKDDSKLNTANFVDEVYAAGLGSYLHENVRLENLLEKKEISVEEALERLGEKITKAQNFSEMDLSVDEASHLLNSERIPNHEELAHLQNQLRAHVMDKLEQLIHLSPNEILAESSHEKSRWVLLSILKKSKITDPDEQEIFLSEFDKKVSSSH